MNYLFAWQFTMTHPMVNNPFGVAAAICLAICILSGIAFFGFMVFDNGEDRRLTLSGGLTVVAFLAMFLFGFISDTFIQR